MTTIERTARVAPVKEEPPDDRRESPREQLAVGERSAGYAVRRGLYYLGLLGASALFLYPFLWLVGASLRPRAFVFLNTPVPNPFAPENYVRIWDEVPLLLWIGNSVVVGLAAAVTVTISSAFVAWGFAYFRFRGRGALFAVLLGTMMLPAAVTMVPVYLIWNSIGLASTQVPLWAGNLFGSAFYIFLMRQFFLTLPRELFDAARVDGASYFGMFWRVALPLSVPVLIITFIFELQASWSDLMRPLIYLRDTSLFTLPRGLKVVLDRFGQGGELQWEIVLAASALATLPMVIIFFCFQRFFVQGIATTGSKG
jgi:multiple sugar transport system permease protein